MLYDAAWVSLPQPQHLCRKEERPAAACMFSLVCVRRVRSLAALASPPADPGGSETVAVC